MKPDETVTKSPLDKPLFQLTEDDISQLTREDCRRYLINKGMRRPSWNKSQAIEQVISLKTLLEPKPEFHTTTDIPKKVVFSHPVARNENVSCREKEFPKPDTSTDVPVQVPDNNTCSSRNSTNRLAGQMTIFYCGKVNVYDVIPAEKALAVMQLAASNVHVPQDSPPAGTASSQSFACQLQAACIRSGLAFPSTASASLHNVVAENSQHYKEDVTLCREVEPEGPISRKASVQRYLEKRKDRGRLKNKRKIGVSTSLEMYLNHQVRDQYPNEQSSQSRACSPPHPRPPHTPTRSNSVENQAKNFVFPIDLNENGKLQIYLVPNMLYKLRR
ncbi:hypothetical protein IFM89_002281 [Coptis chinensis]|uniref:Protein TIFY n=1 Tax=Coptis chinensis TaxID=261450 RepID=A0A835IIR2_9MAGN|nr:hypothetical protein IFM89_002281 [Coptis chinensis]